MELFWQRSGYTRRPECWYSLSGWKNVTDAWGRDFYYPPCWLCEYEEEKLSFLMTEFDPPRPLDMMPPASLYGCPASREVRLPERRERPVTVLGLS